MSTTPAPQQNPLVLYVGNEPPLPADRQASWLLMGRAKMRMDKILQAKALEIQKIFLPFAVIGKVFDATGTMIPFKDWPDDAKAFVKKSAEATAAIAQYKKIQLEMVEDRKGYTCFLEMAKDQCMVTEKLYDPKTSTSFAKAAAFELELRVQGTAAVNANKAKDDEIAGFTAHCKNEYHRIAAQYKGDLAQIIHDAYIACLYARTPVENSPKAIEVAKSAMKEVKAQEMQKYKRTHVTDAEAVDIFSKILKPDWIGIYKDALEALREKFSLYANDLASAPAVIEQQTLSFNAEVVESKNELDATVAATTLTEQANTFTAMPAGMKSVVEITKIKIIDNDQRWVVTIMAAFLANFQKAFPKIGVKLYSKLSVGQMAKALDDAGIRVEGIEYEDIKK